VSGREGERKQRSIHDTRLAVEVGQDAGDSFSEAIQILQLSADFARKIPTLYPVIGLLAKPVQPPEYLALIHRLEPSLHKVKTHTPKHALVGHWFPVFHQKQRTSVVQCSIVHSGYCVPQ
jgi:hypothetical protein